MKFGAVVFDLDGTLLDSIDDLADSMNVALDALCFSHVTVGQCKVFVGDGVQTFASRAMGGATDAAQIDACVEMMQAYYADNWANKTRPFDGIAEMLDALTKLDIPMCVLSNKPHEYTKLCVAKLLGRWGFRIVQGVSDTCPPKPDPAGAIDVAARLGLAPSELLYVGDTNTDMQTAAAAGMYGLGVTWGYRTADELLATGARKLANCPAQVLDCLAELPA